MAFLSPDKRKRKSKGGTLAHLKDIVVEAPHLTRSQRTNTRRRTSEVRNRPPRHTMPNKRVTQHKQSCLNVVDTLEKLSSNSTRHHKTPSIFDR